MTLTDLCEGDIPVNPRLAVLWLLLLFWGIAVTVVMGCLRLAM